MISYHPFASKEKPTFSILIPTWNNLPFVQLCIKSILKNSRYPHQIILHVNQGKDGTLEWVKQQQLDYTASENNVGICWAVNAAFSLAKADYIVYMNDDMYTCPDWDFYLMEEIRQHNDNNFFLSSTMIEPTNTANPCVIVNDFGRSIADFKEEELLAAVPSMRFNDWQGSTWPPNLVHRNSWEMIGGFSVEFSPGMYSDPDFAMKLWQAGIRYFKGVGSSKVYHFQQQSTHRIVKNEGKKQFLKKWGISSSTFTKNILGRGKPFAGSIPQNVTLRPTLADHLKYYLHL